MIVAVLPALDEEASIGPVVRGLLDGVASIDRVIVADNGSRDGTAQVAARAGAVVVGEPRKGYGAACLRGIAFARSLGADIVLMLDADGSDDPADAARVLDPVVAGRADLSLGVRTAASTERGAMTPQQRFGNWLAPRLMRLTVGARYSDMPPYKAIRIEALERLELRDTGHGFTIELLLRAHALGLRVDEVVVSCRRRHAGESKVSGTVRGTLRASMAIVTSIARHAAARQLRARVPERL